MQKHSTYHLATQVSTIMLTTYQDAIEAMKPAIDKLLENYEGFGKQIEKEEHPRAEITAYLEALDIYYPGANKRKLKLAIRQFITGLACFRYRVLARTENQTVAVWNPLEQELSQFVTEHEQQKIVYHTNDMPYPAVDIIADWVNCHIHEDIASD